MLHTEPAWGDKADLQVDVVVPEVDDTVERLWVRSVGGDAYEVCCLSFGLYEVSLGDIVEVAGSTRATPGRVAGVLRRSGRFLIRTVLLDGDVIRMRSLESTFVSLGCLLEGYGPRLLAIDTPDGVAADFIVDHLEQQKAQGGLEYEVAHAPPR